MQQAVKSAAGEHRLALVEVLDWMVEDKLVDAAAAASLKKERRYYKGALHPLAIIAEQKW
jgi:general secretion pathway protein E